MPIIRSYQASAVPSQPNVTPMDEETIARNVHALKNRLRGKATGGGARRRGMGREGGGSGRESVPGSECVFLLWPGPSPGYGAWNLLT